jgi:hypothetical protein
MQMGKWCWAKVQGKDVGHDKITVPSGGCRRRAGDSRSGDIGAEVQERVRHLTKKIRGGAESQKDTTTGGNADPTEDLKGLQD